MAEEIKQPIPVQTQPLEQADLSATQIAAQPPILVEKTTPVAEKPAETAQTPIETPTTQPEGKIEATEPINNGEIKDRDPETGKFLPGHKLAVGKPKGKHMTTLIRQMLKEITYRTATGEMVTADVAIIRRLIDKAAAGKDRSIQEIIDRTDGRPKETLELTQVEITPEAQALADKAIEDYLDSLQNK